MHIQRTLENLGLNKSEASIYLASLELGESTITEISKTTSLPRSSCYEALEKLISLGLIGVLKVGARNIYKAGNPDRFLIMLREREAEIKEILPQLKSKHRIYNNKPALFLYDGAERIKAIFDDILEKQYPLYAITSIDDIVDIFGDNFYDFIEKRFKKNLRVRLLTHQTSISTALKKRDDAELRQTKFLPNSFKYTTANFIYGDRMAIISTKSKNTYGLIIEDADIANTYRSLFEIVWNQSS